MHAKLITEDACRCVRTGEEDEVLLVEAVGAELGAEGVDPVVHVRQRVGVAQVGHLAVAPPRRHVERRPAGLQFFMSIDQIPVYMQPHNQCAVPTQQGGSRYECDGVSRGEDDNVGAGYDAGAHRLDLRLGALDDLQPAEALVLVVVHLGVLVPALDEHRPVAAADEAVVELEAEQRREDGGVGGAGLPDDGGDGGLGVGAGLGVEPHLELAIGEADEEEQHQPQRWRMGQSRHVTATTTTPASGHLRESMEERARGVACARGGLVGMEEKNQEVNIEEGLVDQTDP
ncbi:hypothetical protein U9M48_003972, partial [Paspalum notatum var. saurae]